MHRFLNYLPDDSDTALFIRTMQIDVPNRIAKTLGNLKSGTVYPRPTLVQAIQDSNLTEEDKTPERMSAVALGILGAGTETTAW